MYECRMDIIIKPAPIAQYDSENIGTNKSAYSNAKNQSGGKNEELLTIILNKKAEQPTMVSSL